MIGYVSSKDLIRIKQILAINLFVNLHLFAHPIHSNGEVPRKFTSVKAKYIAFEQSNRLIVKIWIECSNVYTHKHSKTRNNLTQRLLGYSFSWTKSVRFNFLTSWFHVHVVWREREKLIGNVGKYIRFFWRRYLWD